LNSALLVTIAVELISAQEGLGSAIWLAWETLQTEKLYVGLFVIAVLGVAINRLLQMLTKVLTPWQVDPSEY
jgi:NitT/TauT family transport system permease protein